MICGRKEVSYIQMCQKPIQCLSALNQSNKNLGLQGDNLCLNIKGKDLDVEQKVKYLGVQVGIQGAVSSKAC